MRERTQSSMPSYTDSLLANGERILRREHQHWFVLLWNARYAVLGVIVGILLLWIGANVTDAVYTILGYLTVLIFVFALGSFAWSYLRFRNQEYVITSRRIIHTEGVINKRATDSSLEKINDAILAESIFGRIFGFGDLDVLTASEMGIERLRMLRNAKQFKIVMIEAKHELEIEYQRPLAPAASAFGSATSSSGSPAHEAAYDRAATTPDEVTYSLDRLGDLRDRGVITPEEFEAKKQELLGRL